ncbi:SDR family NAD(P)-dependent oxidoreductase [Thalassotalea euphylliae]|uniref:SDR family NAD(P)-dependent oxidoreductase n=1 Tax=Thalassotalea euphylliae TaxID=1655234 RepID=UPI003639B91B
MKTPSVLIIGASSAIAIAAAAELAKSGNSVVAISRSTLADELKQFTTDIRWIQSHYNEHTIAEICSSLAAEYDFTSVIICNGVLHGDDFFPEKKIEELDLASIGKVMNANTLTAMTWLKHLIPVLEKQKVHCYITILSARIGSISDNQLGGWYSYRMSKAALNMGIKCLAIECCRRAKNLKFILFHPGTTDSPLSKPFQRNVKKDKLFTPAFVATQLLAAKDAVEFDGQASYLDWAHKPIDW